MIADRNSDLDFIAYDYCFKYQLIYRYIDRDTSILFKMIR